MKTRVIYEREYVDTRTGERFEAWRQLRGWRLAVVSAAMRALTAGRAAWGYAGSYFFACFACLWLVVILTVLSGCQVQPARAEAGARAVQAEAVETTAKHKEAIYCGAPTKAGGHCRNRVKRAGDHCWVHGGAVVKDDEK